MLILDLSFKNNKYTVTEVEKVTGNNKLSTKHLIKLIRKAKMFVVF